MRKNNLKLTAKEKDLGLYVGEKLNFDNHVTIVVKRETRLSGMIVQNINLKNKDIMNPLFKTVIRPVVEYAYVILNTNLRHNIDRIERVQIHISEKTAGMFDIDYKQRLELFRLPC